ncbi:TraB/GumN family protein [Neptuniibacter sp. CAU 1671]|uniref:TraB/GumN family protein n=1 Tax=Neptuniibacter sp. CAU 1671 TaxID=3032593 RepID=UPI0023DB5DB5|nr:TraB/GumN family protein [Neptuniibacter sp. CAU 1671]MDF2182786.1 TraB/GumN family protein [Neptuniibacter sp. CAU 1671]
MRGLIRLLPLLFCMLINVVYAEGPVWKISDGERLLYLGGSIHVLAEDDWPIPKAFEKAYQASEAVILETDLGQLQQPQTQLKMMQQLVYPAGETLRQHLSESLYAELTAFALERQLNADTFLNLKPAGVMLTLLTAELQRLGIQSAGPDIYFYQRAQSQGKATAGLESVAAHLDYIAQLGMGDEEAFIRQALFDLHETEGLMRSIVLAWRTGDVDLLEHAVIRDMQETYPAVYQSLLVDRNRAWLPQLEALLKTEAVEMVLVGAAHLVGPDGLLKALQDKGYQVEQL